MNILGFSGSLRETSLNSALLRAAGKLLPVGVTLQVASLSEIPLFGKEAGPEGFPEAVGQLRRAIAEADALLFVTPEYNHSIPGVLKNAIDWASCPPDQPFAGKPAAILGASSGRLGTVLGQHHLRQMFVYLDVHPVNKPEVYVNAAGEKFDAELRLADQTSRDLVQQLMTALVDWTRLLGAGRAAVARAH